MSEGKIYGNYTPQEKLAKNKKNPMKIGGIREKPETTGRNREKSGETGKNLHAINPAIVHACRFVEMGAAPLKGARADGRSLSSPQTPSESSPGHSGSVD